MRSSVAAARGGREFLVGAHPTLIHGEGGPIGQTGQSECQKKKKNIYIEINKSELCSQLVGPGAAARCALTVMGCEDDLAGSRLTRGGAH